MRTWIVLHLAAFILVFLLAPELISQPRLWLVVPTILCLLSVAGLTRVNRTRPGFRLILLSFLVVASGALHGGLRLLPYQWLDSTSQALSAVTSTRSQIVAGYFCAVDFDSRKKMEASGRPRRVRLCFDVEQSASLPSLQGRRIQLECQGCVLPQAGVPYQLQIELQSAKRQLPVATVMALRIERYRELSQGGPFRASLVSLAPYPTLPVQHSQQLRAQARQALLAAVARSPHLASYHALFLGDRSGLSHSENAALALSGLSHLMVISGLHVGLMAALVMVLLRSLARLLRLAAWRVPVYLGTVCSLLAYLWLVDYAVPVLRATIMALMFIALTLQRRKIPVGDYWLITLSACLFFDPFAFISAGFWLSFGAVAVIALVMSGRLRLSSAAEEPSLPGAWRHRLKQQSQHFLSWLSAFWRVQWQLFTSLSLLLALFFQQVSLAGLLTNLVAIPLVTLLLVPVGFIALLLNVLLGSWPLTGLLINLSDRLFDLFWFIVESGQYFPVFSTKPLSAEGLALLLLLSLPTLWCWHLPFSPWLHASKLLLLTGFATEAGRTVAPADPQQLRFIVFDVGQGHAALLDDGQTTVLFDTGPVFPISSGFSGGHAVTGEGPPFNPAADQILPYLTQRSRSTGSPDTTAPNPVLDYLFVSHADHDHAGGTGFLLQHLDVSQVFSGEPDKLNRILAHDYRELPAGASDTKRPSPFRQCLAGQTFRSRGYGVEVLWPLQAATRAGFKGNDLSCVLKITTSSQKTILLPGDVEKPALQAMVSHYSTSGRDGVLDVDILVLPHHGSRSSFLPAFISAATPEQVVIPAGANNRFGHPHREPVEWLERRGVTIWNTGTQGYYEFTEALLSEPSRPSAKD